MVQMLGGQFGNILANRKSTTDFMREAQEFEAKKRANVLAEQAAQLDMQKLQKEIETGVSSDDPSSIREWNIFSQMSPEQQAAYKSMKRADQIMNLGGQMAVRSPMGGIMESYQVTPKITDTPEYQAAQAGAQAAAKANVEMSTAGDIEAQKQIGQMTGKREGEVTSELGERLATLPQLENTVKKLSGLGKKATYSYAGRAGDVIRNEVSARLPQGRLGPSEGAVARTEYISTVSNEILPLLRQTFGAQFTQQEGESLKVTLGDPNKTPEEKDAVLRSFIDTKLQTIESQKRYLGMESSPEPSTNNDILSIPMQAINDLKNDPSPEALQEFDDVFGQGAAQKVLVNGQ